LKRPSSRWPVFLFALAGLILTAALIAVSRKGIPFESDSGLHTRPSNGIKVIFLICIVLLGMLQNYVAQKRHR